MPRHTEADPEKSQEQEKMRFQKRIKLLPGISINLSKSGISTSIGPRGAKVTVGNGKRRATVGIPGTGLSHSVVESTSTHASNHSIVATLIIGALLVLATLLLAGCATSVQRATPSELIADPGAREEFTTKLDYDAAYRTTQEQMKSCYERKLGLFGTAQLTVIADKGVKDARVSLSMSSMLNVRTFWSIMLKPGETGTNVTIYGASAPATTQMKATLQGWLNEGETRCPT